MDEDDLGVLEGRSIRWGRNYCNEGDTTYVFSFTQLCNRSIGLFLDYTSTGQQAVLSPVYHLLANIQLARARKAPKIHLDSAREYCNLCLNVV